MFKKIVSNLPFSPSLLPQVGFYVQRLHKENITRQLGIVFACLTIFLQVIVVIISPVPSIASDSNDLILGGLRNSAGQDLSEAQAKSKLQSSLYGSSSVPGLKELFEFYGISQEDISSAETTFICSKEEPSSRRGCSNPEDRNFHSIGRDRNSKDPSKDVRISIPSRGEVYFHRPLHVWDSKPDRASKYKALSIDSGRIFILYSCGNIVFKETPETDITTTKRIVSPTNKKVRPGDNLEFQLSVSNNGNSPAYNVTLVDRLNPSLRAFTPVSDGGTVLRHQSDQQRVEWTIGTLGPGEQAIRRVSVFVIEDARGEIICNRSDAHYIKPDNSSASEHSEPVACIGLEIPREPITTTVARPIITILPETPQPPPSSPQELVPEAKPDVPFSQPQVITQSLSPECLSLQLLASTTEFTAPAILSFTPSYESRQTQATNFSYFINGTLVQSSSQKDLQWTFDEINSYLVQLSIDFSDGTTTPRSDCQASIELLSAPNQRIETSKAARLITSFNPSTTVPNDPRSSNLHQQTVKANELIEYKLLILNNGNVEYENYSTPEEQITDILEYTDVINKDGQRVQEAKAYDSAIELLGGGILENGIVSWSKESLFEPGEQIEKLLIVQVKDPIPETNQVGSNLLRYDCQIDNSYGNTISINIDCPFEKQIEQTVSNLPNTGSGQSFSLLVLSSGLAVFLYQRNKLTAKELQIIKKDYI